MPSVSKTQQRLMGMAYAYKKGNLKTSSPEVKKLANSMNLKDLKDFAKTKHEKLPDKKVKESLVYDASNTSDIILKLFMGWLDNKDVEFVLHDDGKIEIFNEYDLEREDKKRLLDYIRKLGFIKVLEDAGFVTLANTIGVGYVNPPAPAQRIIKGSGDRFDNLIVSPLSSKKLAKKKKENKKVDKSFKYVKGFDDFRK